MSDLFHHGRATAYMGIPYTFYVDVYRKFQFRPTRRAREAGTRYDLISAKDLLTLAVLHRVHYVAGIRRELMPQTMKAVYCGSFVKVTLPFNAELILDVSEELRRIKDLSGMEAL